MNSLPIDSQAGGATPLASLGIDGAPIEVPLGRQTAGTGSPLGARGRVPGGASPGTAVPLPTTPCAGTPPAGSGTALSPVPGARGDAAPGAGSTGMPPPVLVPLLRSGVRPCGECGSPAPDHLAECSLAGGLMLLPAELIRFEIRVLDGAP